MFFKTKLEASLRSSSSEDGCQGGICLPGKAEYISFARTRAITHFHQLPASKQFCLQGEPHPGMCLSPPFLLQLKAYQQGRVDQEGSGKGGWEPQGQGWEDGRQLD